MDENKLHEIVKGVLCLEKVVDVRTLKPKQMADIEAAIYQVSVQNGAD